MEGEMSQGTYSELVGTATGVRPWREIRAKDVMRWNKSRVLAYADTRGLTVEVHGRNVFIGGGVGKSFRAALVDLLEYEEREGVRGSPQDGEKVSPARRNAR